ncbi:MAG: ankyrin repeat domain-containing protein [Intrasporangium sp.]|uniref:ankyrin repeat domain-containing protein n=1 Tax=Intrasporangium sp. TaxID=1925024 RepID=UPI00264893C3|nr:ankyrin repeat domain-containing protein [Intrasporangium sp.]MDN5795361.1 ankyrin repeat domain-containing protein [Intrasporangium sp.]
MTGAALTPEQQEQVVALAMDLAREGRTAELVDFVEHGLPVDVTDREGNTLLMLAAYRGRAETAQALIARGADVDLRNDRDQSPVAGAIFKGEDDIVRALVAAGADLDAGTPTGRAAAVLFGREHLLEAREGQAGG